ncbi:MAG: LON peptidase substrate-binding domain-containing protein [Candidatus Hydrogenedentales bacterium]
MFLPLFPLEIVVYPRQRMPLHIFEPRYRQLVADCRDDGITFGIPAFIEGKLAEYGTELKLERIIKTYGSGEMDILIEGVRVFQLQRYIPDVDGKLYSGGEVEIRPESEESDEQLEAALLSRLTRLYKAAHARQPDASHAAQCLSYFVAPRLGLTLVQQVQVLALSTEVERLAFLVAHLDRVLPVIEKTAARARRIGGNGHPHLDKQNPDLN